ncbi:E3 ubiquitin/ISG15 ligase TRIM25-like [Anomaloglossus baeobatrachus]|uniref:E3 ubiquitin/ISG15 ligase TRIM25-like n=1 Tax=Anomaloglossus baeobatrachus TaxID=238106 RepID=UPI003F4F46B9
MASAILSEELLCSICLSMYTDPVTLRCGHNFCRECIDDALNTQDGSGDYFCPDCREKFNKRPTLKRNITLCNVAERFMSTQSQEGTITGILCTYCIHSPIPAVRSCLHCEASLCDDHLRVHSKGPEHVLTDPSTSLENRKCPVHKKILEYYCTEDAACICVSCSLAGEHRGHQVEMLDEASEKKKKKLRNVLQKMITNRKKTEERIQSLEERRRKAQDKASGEVERVTAVIIDIRRQMDDLEKKILSEISRRGEQVSLSLSDVIQKLEIEKDELSRKMRHIEELCNMTDPLTVLEDPDPEDLCDPEMDGDDEDTGGHDEGDEETSGQDGGDEDTGGHDKTYHIDVDVITGILHAAFSDIITYLQTISPEKKNKMREQPPSAEVVGTGGDPEKVIVSGKGGISVQDPADILLDVNTAANNLLISDDLKTATYKRIRQNRPETLWRFLYNQVMSGRRFTSGRHYWDVEISGSRRWKVGMCYPSIDRRGHQSYIGYNDKSWCLHRGLRCNNDHYYTLIHDRKQVLLPQRITSDGVRVCLDYEAGQLSFYELCDPIRHLHTFTAAFSEPLHAALCVYYGSVKITCSSCEEPSS